jgi:hypothetical protein
MRRREFITRFGVVAMTFWPLAARAQQVERIGRIGALMGYPEAQSVFASFVQELQKLGWAEGRNLRTDIRWGIPADPESMHRFAKELVASQPDLILSQSTPATAALGHVSGRDTGRSWCFHVRDAFDKTVVLGPAATQTPTKHPVTRCAVISILRRPNLDNRWAPIGTKGTAMPLPHT